MDTLVDLYGRLHVADNLGNYRIEDSPPLVFNSIIDCEFTVTQDGDIYSTHEQRVVSNAVHKFIDVHYDLAYEDASGTELYALTVDELLINYVYRDNNLSAGEVIADNVRMISYYYDTLLYITNDNELFTLSVDEGTQQHNISEDIIERVERMTTNLLITDREVIAVKNNHVVYEVEGYLLDARTTDITPRGLREHVVIMIEEVRGEIRISTRPISKIYKKVREYEEFRNVFLEEMNQQSNFTRIVEYSNVAHLLNEEGRLVELLRDEGIRGPPSVQGIIRRMISAKNPYSKIEA